MKRRIRQNVWGNWWGYEGRRRVIEFGTDQLEAEYWLRGEEDKTPKIKGPLKFGKHDTNQTAK